MPQPFTLRADDLSTLAQLYFIAQGTAPAGKVDSLLNANKLEGTLLFPTGQGMRGVNAAGRRWAQFTAISEEEDWYTVSSVTGFLYQRSRANVVTGTNASVVGSMGTVNTGDEGYYELTRVPMLPGTWQDIYVETEPINPLYTGPYAVGPYVTNTVEPSGSDVPQLAFVLPSYRVAGMSLTTANAASTCNPGADGTQAAPVTVAAGGWWTGLLCAQGHTAWSALTVKGNRSFTIEVTAEDEQGFVSTAKAMPVIGVWNKTDAVGSLPGVAAASEAFNGEASGMTTLTVQASQPNQLRVAIADERGDGWPDFNYQARVLYADSLVPTFLPATGGTVTITGTGFRPGNTVTVNGVAAAVTSWSATTIVATVPSLHALGSNNALVADVQVGDLSSGGTTVMRQALTYGTPVPTLNLVTAPSGGAIVGQQIGVPFAVQALGGDGVTPIAGQAFVFSSTGGTVQFGACGAASCTVVTNASGVASTTVTPLTPGAIGLSAAGSAGTQTASINAVTRIRSLTPQQSMEYIAEGATAIWPLQVIAADNTASTAGVPVDWQAVSGPAVLSPAESVVNAQGVAESAAKVGPIAAAGQAVVSACAWTTVCATFTAQGVAASDLRLQIVSGANQTVNATGTLAPVVLLVTDSASHPVAGAVVELYQTVSAWEPSCPDRGRCPIAPVYASSTSAATSDVNGLITLTPQQLAGVAGVTNIVAVTGTQGFVSMTLEEQP